MCFRGSYSPCLPCVLTTCLSAGMMFTIMGEGSPISPNMPDTAVTFRHRPAPHLKRDEIENNTNFFMCSGDNGAGGGGVRGGGKGQSRRATWRRQTQFHLGWDARQNAEMWRFCGVVSLLHVQNAMATQHRGASCTLLVCNNMFSPPT